MHTQTYGRTHTNHGTRTGLHTRTQMPTLAQPSPLGASWQTRPPPPAVFLCTTLAAGRRAQALLVLLSQLGGVSTGRPILVLYIRHDLFIMKCLLIWPDGMEWIRSRGPLALSVYTEWVMWCVSRFLLSDVSTKSLSSVYRDVFISRESSMFHLPHLS